jgi:hypothetical protein
MEAEKETFQMKTEFSGKKFSVSGRNIRSLVFFHS